MTTWHHSELPTPGGGPADFDFGTILSSHVFEAEGTQGTQHVFYGSADGSIYELWWRGSEAAHPRKLAPGSGFLTSHVNEAEGFQHVFYLSEYHIWEISWAGGNPVNQGDLMSANAGSGATEDKPTSHVFKTDSTNHVFYRTDDGHVVELSWQGNEIPRQRDLIIAQNGVAPRANSSLCSHTFEAEGSQGTQHVFYVASGHIIELSWPGTSGDPQWRDLTQIASGKAPLVQFTLPRPASHVFDFERTQHVYYVAENLHIIELWWRPDEVPHAEDLTDRSGGAPLAGEGALFSHVFDFERTQHVYYVAENRHIIELWWRPGEAPHTEDLTDRSGGAPIHKYGNLVSHVSKGQGTQHVFYVSENSHIIELWSQP